MVQGKELIFYRISYLQSASPPALALVAKAQAVAFWLLNDPHARLLLDLKIGGL